MTQHLRFYLKNFEIFHLLHLQKETRLEDLPTGMLAAVSLYNKMAEEEAVEVEMTGQVPFEVLLLV
jgi:hypothetical protein